MIRRTVEDPGADKPESGLFANSNPRRYAAALLAAFVLLLGSNVCQAIEIDNVVWGFDNRVVPRRFNVLSVQVSNPTPLPFEGWMRLQKESIAGEPVDAVCEELLYLAPFSTRWVQFYPYVIHHWERWDLKVGIGRSTELSKNLASPQVGPPAFVIFDDPTSPARRWGSVTRFPETIFPPLSSATSSLGGVLLDHAPRWEESRRRAFLEWLQAGGEVHLFHGDSGDFPKFTDLLSPLNAPLERQRVGSGLVVRHPRGFEKLTPEFMTHFILNGKQQPSGPPNYGVGSSYELFNDTSILMPLRDMTRVAHRWPIIYALCVLYVLMIFPGCFLVGKRIRDYRIVYATLLIGVGVFSVAFSYIGKRGYGERTQVSTVAIAKPLETGKSDGKMAPFEVTEWSQVFVVGGGSYTLTHKSPGAVYSTAQMTERVNGTIFSGVGGKFEDVDIPPYSSCGVTTRTRIERPGFSLVVDHWDKNDPSLSSLALTRTGSFPEKPLAMYAVSGRHLRELQLKNGRLRTTSSLQTIDDFLTSDNRYRYAGINPWSRSEDKRPIDEKFADLIKPLMARSLDAGGDNGSMKSIPPDQVRVYIFAPMTEEFFINNEFLPQQTGRVLYCLDLFPREKE